MRRWRELGEAPVDVAEAIPEVAAVAASEVAAHAAAIETQPVPFLTRTTRKCTGRDLNPYASRRRNLKPGDIQGIGAIGNDSAGSSSEIVRDEAPSEGMLSQDAAARQFNPVDVALARAVADASAAGRFDVVAQLVRELEARRVERREL